MIPGTPVPFTTVELTKLQDYIENELGDSINEHREVEMRLSDWDRAYVGDPKTARRTFPWPNAANVEIPLIGITVDSIVARVVNTIFATEPLWTVRPLNAGMELLAKPMQDYLEWSRKSEMKAYKAVKMNTIELVKYGWSWYKEGWEFFRQPEYITGPGGTPILRDKIIRRPALYHVLNRDMLTQQGVEDYEQAEWIAHRVRLTDNQMRLRIRDGIYSLDFKTAEATRDDSSDFHEAMKSHRNQNTGSKERLHTIYEMWLDYPFGADQVPVPMTLAWHASLKKICRVVFNPYGFRPFRKTHFVDREGRKEGMGIARRLWQLQEEITTLHRQQIDNATLANTRFFLGRRNVIKAGTQIWPGRVLLVNDPAKDLIPYAMGDIYNSQGFLETRAMSYAERASGVSDYQLGRESTVAGSGATATSTLALIQEGNRRFDLNIRDAREVLSDVGRDIILLNQMYRPRGMAYLVQGEKGAMTEALLNLPDEFSVSKLAIELTATTATINKEMEKQGLIALMGITSQYYDKLIQAAMALANPQIPGEIKQKIVEAAEGAKHIMDRIVQTFDVKDVDTLVPRLVDGQTPSPSGAPAGPTGDPTLGGMAEIPGAPPGFGGNGTGGPGEGRELQ